MKKVLLLTIGLLSFNFSYAQRWNGQENHSSNGSVVEKYFAASDAVSSECPGPDNFVGEYYWEDGEFGAQLEWDRAEYENTLDRFEIFRSDNGVDFKLVKRIVNTPSISHYGCVDIVPKPGKYYYQIIAYYQGGCESDPVELMLNVTSVNEESSSTFSVFPNPASNNINVVAKSMNNITVFNAIGQVVVTKNVDGDNVTLDISSLRNGTYIVRVVAENEVFEERMKCLFIDGRLSAEYLQVFSFTGNDQGAINKYSENALFSDAEADETVCSYKQTTYMANMIGSLMVNVFTNFVANEVAGAPIRELPYLTSYDGNSMQFKIE